jgi:hypothetical protein
MPQHVRAHKQTNSALRETTTKEVAGGAPFYVGLGFPLQPTFFTSHLPKAYVSLLDLGYRHGQQRI